MITRCRSCQSDSLTEIISLGNQYLSDFRTDDSKPNRYPLTLLGCESCTLVQLSETAPAEEMYHSRYSFKSGVNPSIKKDLGDNVRTALQYRPDALSWLDIASNDGTLLSQVPAKIFRVGIDPLEQFSKEAKTHANLIIVDFFNTDYFNGSKFDVVTSISMFYDLDDPNDFVAGVKSVLAEDGVWIIQQNYLRDMLRLTSFDNISHEHVCYYSMSSLTPLLERHGLEIINVIGSDINGGCFRTVVAHKGVFKKHENVETWTRAEKLGGFNFNEFTSNVYTICTSLRSLVEAIRKVNKQIYVYGASTRGSTIWQACNMQFDYVVDRNPDKVGKIMSSIGAQIIDEATAREHNPQYMLVGPWWFRKEFVEREKDYLSKGGKLIFPIPYVEIVGK